MRKKILRAIMLFIAMLLATTAPQTASASSGDYLNSDKVTYVSVANNDIDYKVLAAVTQRKERTTLAMVIPTEITEQDHGTIVYGIGGNYDTRWKSRPGWRSI